MPESEEDHIFDDHKCPRCGDEDASIDGGHVCLVCGYIDGDCANCGHISSNLTIWMSEDTFYENIPDKAIPTTQEKEELYNEYNPTFDGCHLFRPPYIPVTENGEKDYICQSMIWSFKCERCNNQFSTHCD